jgi:hypothetical protein
LEIKAENERKIIKDFSPVETLGYRGTKLRAVHDKALHDAGVYNILNAGLYDNIPSFLGYMTLAELSQDGVIKAGVDLRADEMTRRWIEFMYKGESGDDLINQLEDDIDRLHVQKIFREAIKMCGFYGGCLVYIDVGNVSNEELKLPLGGDTDTIKPDSIQGLKIIEPFYIAPCRYDCSNPINKNYYVPQSWLVNGNFETLFPITGGMFKLFINWMQHNQQMLTGDVQTPYTNNSLSIDAIINGMLFRKLNWKYELEYGSTHLRIGDDRPNALQGFEHSFSLYYSPVKKLSLSLIGEYYHNEVSDHQYSDHFLIDTKTILKLRSNLELTLSLNNILNVSHYAYTTYTELMSLSGSQPIRGRELLLSLYFRPI